MLKIINKKQYLFRKFNQSSIGLKVANQKNQKYFTYNFCDILNLFIFSNVLILKKKYAFNIYTDFFMYTNTHIEGLLKPFQLDSPVSSTINRVSTNINVGKYVDYFADMWKECNSYLPDFGQVYSSKEKLSREQDIEKFFTAIRKEANKTGVDGKESLRNYDKFTPAIKLFLKDGLHFGDEEIDLFFSNEFLKITSQFIEAAREFDPTIRPEEIYQACRNVWAMNWMQLFLKKPVELTPSIFAYSMLYPYTDNFIDDPNISFEDKINFNERLYKRLEGETIEAGNSHEQIIYTLIGMIESQYDRSIYPGVFESLLAIHTAQIKSLMLFDEECTLTENEILNISLEKGGASVLVDGYLVAGNLTEDQKVFLFGYGAYLQLVDDLQDVGEDSRANVRTIYSVVSGKSKLDELINQTYNFGNRILSGCDLFSVDENACLFEIMKKGSKLLLIGAVGLTSEYYSSSHVEKMEEHSPFHFSFIRKNQKNFFSYGMQMLKISNTHTRN